VGIGQLKAEPRNDAEVGRLLTMARTRLADARLAGASAEGRFTSAYNAAHAASLAALRWVLDAAHQKRNLAEYEGVLDVEESAIKELCAVTAELIADVAMLVGAPKPKP
jgi:hypothetical protein